VFQLRRGRSHRKREEIACVNNCRTCRRKDRTRAAGEERKRGPGEGKLTKGRSLGGPGEEKKNIRCTPCKKETSALAGKEGGMDLWIAGGVVGRLSAAKVALLQTGSREKKARFRKGERKKKQETRRGKERDGERSPYQRRAKLYQRATKAQKEKGKCPQHIQRKKAKSLSEGSVFRKDGQGSPPLSSRGGVGGKGKNTSFSPPKEKGPITPPQNRKYHRPAGRPTGASSCKKSSKMKRGEVI